MTAPDLLRRLNRATLDRQLLLERSALSPLKAIERLVAMQAQVPRPPFVGLWTRLRKFEREQLLALLHRRSVVRVTSLRGTLHLMSAADYHAMRGTLHAMLDKGRASIRRDRTDEAALAAMDKRARAFFAKPATFDTFRQALLAADPGCDERAIAYSARMRIPLVQVPGDDRWGFPAAASFQVADKWLGKPVSTQDAPPDALVLRYLAAFGPATPADFQAWSGIGGTREVFQRLRPKLDVIQDGQREYFDLPKAPRPDPETMAPVRFLPEFDNLVLAHQDRTRVLADAHRPKVVSKNLQVAATFLVDGFVAGTWSLDSKKKGTTLRLAPFGPLPRATKSELEREGESLLAFLVPESAECAVSFTSA